MLQDYPATGCAAGSDFTVVWSDQETKCWRGETIEFSMALNCAPKVQVLSANKPPPNWPPWEFEHEPRHNRRGPAVGRQVTTGKELWNLHRPSYRQPRWSQNNRPEWQKEEWETFGEGDRSSYCGDDGGRNISAQVDVNFERRLRALNFLKSVSIFRELAALHDSATEELFQDMSTRCKWTELEPGSMLYNQGEIASNVFFVIEGQLRVQRRLKFERSGSVEGGDGELCKSVQDHSVEAVLQKIPKHLQRLVAISRGVYDAVYHAEQQPERFEFSMATLPSGRETVAARIVPAPPVYVPKYPYDEEGFPRPDGAWEASMEDGSPRLSQQRDQLLSHWPLSRVVAPEHRHVEDELQWLGQRVVHTAPSSSEFVPHVPPPSARPVATAVGTMRRRHPNGMSGLSGQLEAMSSQFELFPESFSRQQSCVEDTLLDRRRERERERERERDQDHHSDTVSEKLSVDLPVPPVGLFSQSSSAALSPRPPSNQFERNAVRRSNSIRANIARMGLSPKKTPQQTNLSSNQPQQAATPSTAANQLQSDLFGFSSPRARRPRDGPVPGLRRLDSLKIERRNPKNAPSATLSQVREFVRAAPQNPRPVTSPFGGDFSPWRKTPGTKPLTRSNDGTIALTLEIGEIGSGEYFGEIEVYSQLKRASMVVASSKCILLSMPRDIFCEHLPRVIHGALLSHCVNKTAWRNARISLVLDMLRRAGLKVHHGDSRAYEPEFKPSAMWHAQFKAAVASMENRDAGAHGTSAKSVWGMQYNGPHSYVQRGAA